MSIATILIGTATLWLVNAVAIVPLTQFLVRHRLGSEIAMKLGIGNIKSCAYDSRMNENKKYCYVLASIVVLAVGGFIIGVLARQMFIGFSLTRWGWPGMFSMMLFSLLGSALG